MDILNKIGKMSNSIMIIYQLIHLIYHIKSRLIKVYISNKIINYIACLDETIFITKNYYQEDKNSHLSTK